MNKYFIPAKYSIIIINLIIILAGCNKDEENNNRPFPRIITDPVTKITKEGATFTGEIIFTGTAEITDYGFFWAEDAGFKSNAEHISLGPNPGKGSFNSLISTTLVTGKTYYVKAYAKAGQYTVMGNTESFKSLGSSAPKVLAIIPDKGDFGDTIDIIGKNFSYNIKTNVVQFGEVTVDVLRCNNDSIRAVIPDKLDSNYVEVSVSIAGNIGYADQLFELNAPVISKLTPDKGGVGDLVTLDGNNFIPGKTKVLIETTQARNAEVAPGQITFALPSNIKSGQVHIKVNVFNKTGDAVLFNNLSPYISGYTPRSGPYGATITIQGSNFSSNKDLMQVFFNGYSAKITSSSSTEIKATVPDSLDYYKSGIKIINNYNYYCNSSDSFRLSQASITGISPTKATSGGWIVLTGSNFAPQKINNSVYFNDIEADILSNNKNSITVEVPVTLGANAVISLTVAGQASENKVNFTYASPQITDFQPATGRQDTIVTMTGFFSPDLTLNKVKLGDTENAQIISADNNNLRFRIPYHIPAGNYNVSVTIGDYTSTAQNQLKIFGPVLNSFSPQSGSLGDTITISGTNFSNNPADIDLKADAIPMYIITAKFNSIKAIIPDELNKRSSLINLNIAGTLVSSSAGFTLDPPVILSIDSLPAIPGTDIILTGKNLSPVTGNNDIVIQGKQANIKSSGYDNIVFSLPYDLTAGITSLSLTVAEQSVSYNNFEIVGPEITGFTPLVAGYLDTIRITGNNFPENISDLKIGSDSYYPHYFPDILSTSKNEIIALVPDNVITGNKLFVINSGIKSVSADIFTYPFEKTYSISTQLGRSSRSFNLMDKSYLFYDSTSTHPYNDFWEYNPSSNSFKQLAVFPGKGRRYVTLFTLLNKIYIGLGVGANVKFQDFYKYDPLTNSWTRIADFPGPSNAFGFAFNDGAYGYAGNGGNQGFYKYNPSDDSWTRAADYPGYYIINFTVSGNGVGYVASEVNYSKKTGMWKYDPVLDEWTLKATVPGINWTNNCIISSHYAYCHEEITGPTNFWRYDLDTDTWEKLPNRPFAYFDIGVEYQSRFIYGLIDDTNNIVRLWYYTP